MRVPRSPRAWSASARIWPGCKRIWPRRNKCAHKARAATPTGKANRCSRVEPTGGNSVRVSFEVADFDALMNWLDALARDYGVQATDFSADKVEGLGLANARVTLEDRAQ